MSKIGAILGMKCPRCHEGKLYKNSNSFNLKTLHEMNKTCSCCGQNFDPEPGFYYGAMYVSYGLSVALFALFFIAFVHIYPISGFAFITSYTITLLALFPYIFRYSRVLYIHLFYGYDHKAKDAYTASKEQKN
jgi:hypothetical protein